MAKKKKKKKQSILSKKILLGLTALLIWLAYEKLPPDYLPDRFKKLTENNQSKSTNPKLKNIIRDWKLFLINPSF